MKKILCLGLMMLGLSCIGYADPLVTNWVDDSGGNHRGRIRRTEVNAGQWGKTIVRIYLPEAFTNTSATRFPVLYAFDGNNCFHPGHDSLEQDWHLDEVVDDLIKAHKLNPMFVVTIDQPGDRMGAYTPRRIFRGNHEDGGAAKDYGDFVLRIKETIDGQFPTNPKDAGLLGSSLGGLLALHTSYQHGEAFSRAAVMSPSLWWMGRPGTGDLVPREKLANGPLRLWIDMGSDEDHDDEADDATTKRLIGEQYVELASSLTSWLQSQQGPGRIIKFTRVDGGVHRETAWHARLADVLRWLYPTVL